MASGKERTTKLSVRLGKYEGDALTTGVTLETCCEVKEARLKRGCTV